MIPPEFPHGEENRLSIKGSNLDIPRFVTIKTDKANMRTGPGRDYPVKWEYQRRGLPMKVIGEHNVWREVVGPEGESGWMHTQTLTGRRMVLIVNNMESIHQYDDPESRIIAVAEKGVLTKFDRCHGDWCQINTQGVGGWIRKNAIWGIIEGEELK